MRLLYGKRRDYLVSLIQRYLGPEFIHEYDEAAGLHLVLNYRTLAMMSPLQPQHLNVASKFAHFHNTTCNHMHMPNVDC